MPRPPLKNTFAGGADGVGITTANSGGTSGNAFNGGVSVACAYSADHARTPSNVCMKIPQTGVYASAFAAWSALGVVTSTLFGRFYTWLTATPTTEMGLAAMIDSPGLFSTDIVVTTGGLLSIHGVGAVSLATGQKVLPLNQWIRFDFALTPSLTNGTFEVRWFANADDDTLTESISKSAALKADVEQVRFGMTSLTNQGPINQTHYWAAPEIWTGGWRSIRATNTFE